MDTQKLKIWDLLFVSLLLGWQSMLNGYIILHIILVNKRMTTDLNKK